MKVLTRFFLFFIIFVFTQIAVEHDHSGHKHAKPVEMERHGKHEDHDGHDHREHKHAKPVEEHSKHEDHEEVDAKFNKEQIEELKIKLAKAKTGYLSITKTYPGELRLNQNRVSHLSPRVAGFVDEVEKNLGDYVAEGETLAYFNSPELGEAKASYIESEKELEIAQHDLKRIKDIKETFLSRLDSFQNDKDQLDTNRVTIDESIGDFIKSFSRFKLADKNWVRERRLFKEKVISEESLLQAKSEYEKAKADFDQQKDQQRFLIERKLLQKEKAYKVAKLKFQAAKNRLILLGLETDEIASLKDIQFGRDVTISSLKAPISGFIVEQHLVLGEWLTPETNAYTIADLSNYWAIFQVYSQDAMLIQRNQPVDLNIANHKFSGVIDYISDQLNEDTRSFDARVTIPKSRGLKGGMFLEAQVQIRKIEVSLLVPKTAIFEMDNRKVVYIKHGDKFEPSHVTLGREDDLNHEVLDGLRPGQIYASAGGFHIKAELQKGLLGDGHGH